MGRVLFHLGGIAFLAWVVLVAAKWAFVAGLTAFGLHAWDTRPGGEERARQAEQARRERPIPPEERVRGAVQGASAVTLRLVERRWLRATVQARNPTDAAVELNGVRCRVLFSPDGGQRPDTSNRGPWRIRLEPGGTYQGEIRMYEPDAPPVAPLGLAEYRCMLDVRVLPTPTAPPGAPSNPIRATPGGYRG
jgi:hypothetical protein